MNQRPKNFALSACALGAAMLVAACGGGGADPVPDDTAAPTLVIGDNIDADRATGAVSFIFNFNEPVTGFSNSDIVTSGGTAGTIIKVNDLKYLVEVTPPPESMGTVSVRVAAGAFTDMSGNANAVGAMHAQDFNTVRPAPPPAAGDVLLASFDEATPLVFEGFNGAETSAIAAGPAGGNGLAGQIVRLGGEVWAGAKVNVGSVPLTEANRTISARVYSPLAGVPIVLKLENAADPQNVNTGDLQANETVVQGWQTLTWEVPADKVGPTYEWVVMLPNLGTLANTDPGETYYFDDIKLVVAAAPSVLTLASFDEATPLVFEGFNGAETSAIAAGPEGGNGLAGQIVRLGGEVWAGAKVNVGSVPLTEANRTISARVYSPLAGVPIVLKLENAADPQNVNTGDLQANETVVVGWQTLTWEVPADKVGPDYEWVVMLPNLGTLANTDPGETYYFDDIQLLLAPPPAGTVLASFDEATALAFEGFNGAETSAIAAGPEGGSGLAAQVIRLGGEVWAGAKVNVGPVPLTPTTRRITARVYSPLAGVPIVLKLENASDPQNINTGDLQANETVLQGWQTLSWNVPADRVGPEYVWVVMLPNLGTLASTDPGETYFFDDITLVDGP